jgi:hypothetical protein
MIHARSFAARARDLFLEPRRICRSPQRFQPTFTRQQKPVRAELATLKLQFYILHDAPVFGDDPVDLLG